MSKVVSILKSKPAFLKIVREICKDSDRVFLTPANQKGFAGKIKNSQVWKCLEDGVIISEPVIDEDGNYLFNMNHAASGADIYLSVLLDISIPEKKQIYVLHVSEG